MSLQERIKQSQAHQDWQFAQEAGARLDALKGEVQPINYTQVIIGLVVLAVLIIGILFVVNLVATEAKAALDAAVCSDYKSCAWYVINNYLAK
ncbi:MAG: hypothetical protein BroJett025_01420 [Patescibacteria group bacterium]|nr:MAG: hypothetical protein BroJett025_01420 [Patescibacteria group bacterium]